MQYWNVCHKVTLHRFYQVTTHYIRSIAFISTTLVTCTIVINPYAPINIPFTRAESVSKYTCVPN